MTTPVNTPAGIHLRKKTEELSNMSPAEHLQEAIRMLARAYCCQDRDRADYATTATAHVGIGALLNAGVALPRDHA